MKVIHAIPSLDPKYGGPAFAFVELLSHLRIHGVDVEAVVTFKKQNDPSLMAVLQQRGVKVNALGPTISPLGFHRNLSKFIRECVDGADVVHLHGVFELMHSLFIKECKSKGIPVVLRPFGVLSKFSLGQKSFRKRVGLSTWGRSVLRDVTVYHMATQRELNDLGVKIDSSKVLIVPNGCSAQDQLDPEELKSITKSLGIPLEYNLFLGRIHPIKGLEMLLAAYQKLGSEIPPLVVAGHGEAAYVQQLQVRAQELGLASRIFWIPDIYGKMKNSVITQATALLLSSKHENFSNVALEAVALGTPVIVSEEVGFSEFVKGLSLGLSVPRTADAFAEAIKFSSSEFRNDGYRLRAQRVVLEKFSWDTIAKRWVEIYTTLKDRK